MTKVSGNSDQRSGRKLFPLLLYGYALLSVVLSLWLETILLQGFAAAACLAIMIYHGSEYFALRRYRQMSNETRVEAVENERIFTSLFHHNPNVIGLMDAAGKFKRVNATAERILGFTQEELKGCHYHSIMAAERVEKARVFYQDLLRGIPLSFKTAVLHKEGYRVDLDVMAVPMKDDQGRSEVLLICQDITVSKRTEEQIRHMAYYDDMTGLPNRRMFVKQLKEAILEAAQVKQALAVLFLDVDRFKMVNDSFGHDYGDMLLLQVAERLTRCMTEKDFVARTEGDEFALLFTGVKDAEQAREIAESIFHVLEEPFTLEQYHLHVTASIGIAVLSEAEEDADSLMKCADIALTRAKDKGKNNFQLFNSDMKSVSLKRLTLENELRRAITRNELKLHYQPQMEIESGRIIGFEALIRWEHPERGMVPPKDFIPFAEESGLIVPIGEWVMREACRQNKEWHKAGYEPLPVAVNLSTRQFLQHNLTEKITQVLEETGLEPSYLELEITESSTMDVDYVSELLQGLKRLGVKISIDDFGTGYSSLYYLKRFPIDKLKIDRSFVRDIMTDPNDAAIVASIIAMTRHLNLRVIAEGVETEEQLQFLHSNHCSEIQGYWFSPPLTAAQVEQLMDRQQSAAAASAAPESGK